MVSRFGAVRLRRQVRADLARHTPIMPGTAAVPAYDGVVTTRGLQEWACLLPQELPFSAIARFWRRRPSGLNDQARNPAASRFQRGCQRGQQVARRRFAIAPVTALAVIDARHIGGLGVEHGAEV